LRKGSGSGKLNSSHHQRESDADKRGQGKYTKVGLWGRTIFNVRKAEPKLT